MSRSIMNEGYCKVMGLIVILSIPIKLPFVGLKAD